MILRLCLKKGVKKKTRLLNFLFLCIQFVGNNYRKVGSGNFFFSLLPPLLSNNPGWMY